MIEAENRTATVSFDGHAVTITRHRDGFVPRGTRTIPITQISAIRWKPASKWRGPGHLRFVLAGTVERRYSQTAILKTDVLKDENAVPFSHGQQPAFEALKAAIERALAQSHVGPVPPAGPGSATTMRSGSLADELGKLQQLREAGALSPQEFEQAKARLLG